MQYIDISIRSNKDTRPKILYITKHKEECPKERMFEVKETITIGKGPNAIMKLELDSSLDDPQFQITLKDNKFIFQCLSRQYLTLFKFPPRQKIRIKKGAYFLLSTSEAFYVKECEHGRILKDLYETKLKNDKTIISPYIFMENEQKINPKLELECYMGDWKNKKIETITKEKCKNDSKGYKIGRKEDCNLVINDNGISLYHLNILYEEDVGFLLQENNDKGSLNGSYLAINSLENKKSGKPSDPFYISEEMDVIDI